ncbi:MAG: hypothetical protein WD740_01195 [Anaerolineales bacterium]
MAEVDPQQQKKEMFGEGTPESRFITWTRRIIISLLALAVTVLLLWFLLLAPKASQISQLEDQLAASQAQVSTLEASVADLETLKPQREVLSLLVDANSARYELARNHPDEAAAALLNTERTLALLASELGEELAGTISTLQERLDLAKAAIEDNRSFAARSDLEVFVNILLQLQRSLHTP